MGAERLEHQGDGIEVRLSRHPDAYESDIRQCAALYMTVFGNAPGIEEGGIREDGSRISLSKYLQMLVGAEVLHCESSLSTPQIMKLVQDMESVDPSLLQIDGYRPYYSLSGVHQRLRADLMPDSGANPLFCSWHEGDTLQGFATGVLTYEDSAFRRLVYNMPYLNQAAREQVFMYTSNMGYPFLFQLEGAVSPDLSTSGEKTRWPEVLLSYWRASMDLNINVSVAFTLTESNFYKASIRNETFLRDFPIEDNDGGWRYVVTDIRKSAELLYNKLNNK